MLLTSLTPKHMYSYISETNFESSTIIIVSTGYKYRRKHQYFLKALFSAVTVTCQKYLWL